MKSLSTTLETLPSGKKIKRERNMTTSKILPCLACGVGCYQLVSLVSKQERVSILSTMLDTWRKGRLETWLCDNDSNGTCIQNPALLDWCLLRPSLTRTANIGIPTTQKVAFGKLKCSEDPNCQSESSALGTASSGTSPISSASERWSPSAALWEWKPNSCRFFLRAESVKNRKHGFSCKGYHFK